MIKGETTVTMPVSLYETYKTVWDAVNNNLDLKIEKGFYYVGYIFKTESDAIKALMHEITDLQDEIRRLKQSTYIEEKGKRKWFNL